MTEPARIHRRSAPSAPEHLSDEARALWDEVLASFELETHHRAILASGLEALDRMRQAQEAIASDGAYVEGRFGMKAHPAIAVERDSRTAFLRAVRELGLDLEAPASRPPTRWQS